VAHDRGAAAPISAVVAPLFLTFAVGPLLKPLWTLGQAIHVATGSPWSPGHLATSLSLGLLLALRDLRRRLARNTTDDERLDACAEWGLLFTWTTLWLLVATRLTALLRP
jgi:hypothetical protein